tara:strand:- start:782 stop:952 length:171 start_codon:yes stop_codon:yes gene_type:complete
MSVEDVEEYKVKFLIKRDELERDFNDTEWENLKMILNSNTESYIKRCLWILEQIEE